MNYFDYVYRVRYADTDKMNVSYYANYLVWFEAARTEYFRALGYAYTRCEEQGYYLPVREAMANYQAPSTYDDPLIVRTSVAEMTRTSLRFEYIVLHAETQKTLATGYTLHVFVDRTLKPCRIPEFIRSIVTPFKLLSGDTR
ncbi:MAG: acyl-CoA thioesterase [Candidatus Omnitrophota bacterium]